MPKPLEPEDCVVWETVEGAMHGTVRSADAFGINIIDEDGKVHRVNRYTFIVVVAPENQRKLAYALSSAKDRHLTREAASKEQLKQDREIALGKWGL